MRPSPRDAVTISRLFHDANAVIDITTSLPRSSDEPAYLRPSPPFVRSHVKRTLPSTRKSCDYLLTSLSLCLVYTTRSPTIYQ
jgi:hypothetical protein